MAAMALALALRGCGGGLATQGSDVAAQRLVHTGVAEDDLFFRIVHTMQIALNESQRVKVEAVSELADDVGLPDDADIDRAAGAVRSRVEALQRQGVSLVVHYDAHLAPVGAQEAGNDPSGIVPEPQATAEERAGVSVSSDPPSGGSRDSRLVSAVRAFLQTTVGLAHRMDEVIALARQFRAAGVRLRAEAPRRMGARAREIDADFQDALDFLDGAPARAQAEGLTSLQLAARIQNSATLAAP
jgi:hypothetical protein